jgi:RNA polymerase sigma factor (sigma-70 family)
VISCSARFPTTHWTLVLSATKSADLSAGRALAELCRAYWQPLYAFVRRCGYPVEEAQDLTQEFFARLLEKHYLTRADPARGRFRSFLLSSMKHFLADEYDRQHAQKRGQHATLQIEFYFAEPMQNWEPRDDETPEKAFERAWALALLSRVTAQLRESFAREGHASQFDCLKQFLPGTDGDFSYAEAARRLGRSEGAAKVAVHRLRRRYREVLYREIAHTVLDSVDIGSEIRYLLQVLAP